MSSLTIWERVSLFPRFLPLPGVLLYTALASFFSKSYKGRKLYRIIFEAAGRYVTRVATVSQLQWVSGSTLEMYETWAKKRGVSPVVEKVRVSEGEEVNLYWIGDKEAEQVLIYIHGGGFMLPISDFMFTFWDLVHQGVKKRSDCNCNFSIAVLDYSLHPATFPNQLRELIQTINHCLLKNPRETSSNLKLHLAGDSCGANIILQLVSHTFHPIPGIPPSPLRSFGTGTPRPPLIRSVLLISPWTTLDEESPSQTMNTTDALDARTLRRWGAMYVSGIPSGSGFDYVPYVKIHKAPADWLGGVDMHRVLGRVMITTGTAECLLDDAEVVYELLKRHSGRGLEVRMDVEEGGIHLLKRHSGRGLEVRMDVEEGGIHDDPIFDIGAGSRQLNDVGERMVDWLVESCRRCQ